MAKTGILLLHGLTGMPSEMRPLVKYLSQLGLEIESPMLAGHGGSHTELLDATWKDWVSSARQTLDSLLSRVDQVVIIGLSMGGTVGGILAVNEPRVVGLVMLSPTLAYDGSNLEVLPHQRLYRSEWVRKLLHNATGLIPGLGRMLYWTETPPYGLKDERLQKQITKSIEAASKGESCQYGLFRTYFTSLYQMNLLTAEFKRLAPQLRVPALLVSSLEDTIVSIFNPTDTYSLLGTREKSLVLLSGCDHVMTLDLQKNYVLRLVGEFLESLLGVSAKKTDASPKLSIEIHNKLNPLSLAEWSQLIPSRTEMGELLPALRNAGIHESNCHAMVVRHHDRPVMLLPLALRGANSAGGVSIGFDEKFWFSPITQLGESGISELIWHQVRRVLNALAVSFKCRSASTLQAGENRFVENHRVLGRIGKTDAPPLPKSFDMPVRASKEYFREQVQPQRDKLESAEATVGH